MRALVSAHQDGKYAQLHSGRGSDGDAGETVVEAVVVAETVRNVDMEVALRFPFHPPRHPINFVCVWHSGVANKLVRNASFKPAVAQKRDIFL